VGAIWLLSAQINLARPGVLPFAASAAIVACIALASSLFPAWRATLLSPMVAIRNDSASMRLAVSQVFDRWSAAGERGEDLPPSPDAGMMTALIEASRRRRDSARRSARRLMRCGRNLGAHSVVLLEVGGEELRATASAPDQGWGTCAIRETGGW
jgi:hypothetical protein